MSNASYAPREQYPRRLHDLEQRFGALFGRLEDSPQKEALSILHGITQELWRQLRPSASPLNERGLTLEDSHPTVYVGGEVLIEPSISELSWALSRSGLR